MKKKPKPKSKYMSPMSDTPRASNQRARPDRKLWPLTAEGDNLFNHELQMWQYDEIDRLQKRVAELERCQHAGWDYARGLEDAKKHPETLGLQRAAEPPVVARHLDEWHEDIGDVVWWKFPMDEPAYIGSPLADDWPGYHTHWTPHPAVPERIGYPSETKSGGISCQCPAEPNEPCPLTDEECRKRALRRSTSGETGACRQYIPFRYGDASKCANCGQPDIKHTSDERVRAMNLCDRCGTWHLESPAPRNCKECGKRMGSGMVRTPDGDPAGGVVPVPAGGYADTGSAFRAPVRKTE